MTNEAIQDMQHHFRLCLTDSFDHEFLVMCEEEEAATFARALACLEDLMVIVFRVKTFFQHLQRQIVKFKELSKLVQSVVSDLTFKGYLECVNHK